MEDGFCAYRLIFLQVSASNGHYGTIWPECQASHAHRKEVIRIKARRATDTNRIEWPIPGTRHRSASNKSHRRFCFCAASASSSTPSYGVTTKALNQAVKRNTERFPEDFLFRLSGEETKALNRPQSVTGSQKHRNPRFPPFAFTEHGAIMAATILSSPRAVEMSIYVVRAFVQLRELLASNAELARRLDELEGKLVNHDEAIIAILSAIRELTNSPAPKRRGIGFTADLEKSE